MNYSVKKVYINNQEKKNNNQEKKKAQIQTKKWKVGHNHSTRDIYTFFKGLLIQLYSNHFKDLEGMENILET